MIFVSTFAIMFLRKQLLEGSGNESLFLWGARQTGKSTLLKSLFPDALWFDLLLSDIYLTQVSQLKQIISGVKKVKKK